jgi:hypothetical protein
VHALADTGYRFAYLVAALADGLAAFRHLARGAERFKITVNGLKLL